MTDEGLVMCCRVALRMIPETDAEVALYERVYGEPPDEELPERLRDPLRALDEARQRRAMRSDHAGIP
jgi:hypothetical protein